MSVPCIYALAVLTAQAFAPLRAETRQILDYADTAVCKDSWFIHAGKACGRGFSGRSTHISSASVSAVILIAVGQTRDKQGGVLWLKIAENRQGKK
jgi:hypothetical protein